MKKSTLLVIFGSLVAAGAVSTIYCAREIRKLDHLFDEIPEDIWERERLAKQEHLKVLQNDPELLAAVVAWLDRINGTEYLLDFIKGQKPAFFDENIDNDGDDETECSPYYGEGLIWTLRVVLEDDEIKRREAYRHVASMMDHLPIKVLDVNIENCMEI